MKTIPSRAGFLAARSKGAKALARGLVIHAVIRDSDDWRIGLTATKKIGNAATRNRARRRMRALARDHLSPLAKNGIDYVLIARHDTATANWQDMAIGLQKAIRYLHRTIAAGTKRGAKPNVKPNAQPTTRPMTDNPSQGEA
ncbi:ribonuclease P protein component [Candidatus Puniceispirillum sp.]|nr:ribonuclease P protein component [bacterium]MDC0650098.1 ribonuclease P protein component [Alphaproteobacteria bacterium]MDC1293780.1 ribonuclease P protein component [Candidatus Puniceispirillum sp.]